MDPLLRISFISIVFVLTSDGKSFSSRVLVKRDVTYDGYQTTHTPTSSYVSEPNANYSIPFTKIGDYNSCGLASKFTQRIVGGKDANKGEFCFLAAILKLIRGEWNQICGGSIISSSWILTAAHCLVDSQTTEMIVRLGEYDFSTTDDVNHIDAFVKAIIVNKYFDNTNFQNDLGLMQLENQIKFSLFICPVCLPIQDWIDPPLSPYVAIGWGTTLYLGNPSNIPKWVTLPLMSTETCNDYVNPFFPTNQICAGDIKGGIDACQGDSGGPLVIFNNDRWHLRGIVSWGDGCAKPNTLGVYTKCSHFIDWITYVMQLYSV